MSNQLGFHVVTAEGLRSGMAYEQWSDPDGLARMMECKRRAFLTNPLLRSDAEPVQVICTLENRVIGRIDLLAGEFHARGASIPVLWGSALYVAPQVRRVGAARGIVGHMHGLGQAVAICGISEMSSGIYDKLQWTRFKMPRYVCLVRSRPLVRRFVRHAGAAGFVQRLADGALTLPRAAASAYLRLRARGIRARELSTLPAAWDPEFLPPASVAASHRSSGWINWLLENRFEEDPRTRRRLCVVETRGGQAMAYFLIKVRYAEVGQRYGLDDFSIGSLQDWLIFCPARLSLTELVLMALHEGAALGADLFAAYLTEPAQVALLRGLGFFPFPGLDFLFRAEPGTILAQEEFQHPQGWRLRPGDGDNFFS